MLDTHLVRVESEFKMIDQLMVLLSVLGTGMGILSVYMAAKGNTLLQEILQRLARR